jgi:hypothetical protein
MRPEEESRIEAPFWHLDEELGELELRERPSGPDIYTVRLKAHTATGPYLANQQLYRLQHDGTQHELSGKAYILVPDVTLTVGLFPSPQSSGAIGTVTESAWQGMRHHDIANLRGLYYAEDHAIGIWEVDAWGRLDEFTHGRLWQLFEAFLLHRFPQAQRMYSDDAGPGESTKRNRTFLATLGYSHVIGSHRIWEKEVRP